MKRLVILFLAILSVSIVHASTMDVSLTLGTSFIQKSGSIFKNETNWLELKSMVEAGAGLSVRTSPKTAIGATASYQDGYQISGKKLRIYDVLMDFSLIAFEKHNLELRPHADIGIALVKQNLQSVDYSTLSLSSECGVASTLVVEEHLLITFDAAFKMVLGKLTDDETLVHFRVPLRLSAGYRF